MSEIYRKWGRVARWDHGALVQVAEAGESLDATGDFHAEPMQTGDSPIALADPDADAVERAAREIMAMIDPPLTVERLIVTEGVALHEFDSVQWQERTRRLHLSVARPPFRMLIDAAGFELDRTLLSTFAAMRLEPAPLCGRVILEPPVSAALLTRLGELPLQQAQGERDGKGQPIIESTVSVAPPPNWYRPSYRMRPLRSWFHLRAVPHGTIDHDAPRAVALLSFPTAGRIHALCVEEGSASPRWISPGRVLAAGPPVTWYPYGAGCWGADILLESAR